MREVMRWNYRDREGHALGHVLRLEEPLSNGKGKTRKQIIPYFKRDGSAGIPEDMQGKDRVFGRESCSDFSRPIFIAEGEKCAYALQGLGYQAITSLGGSGQGHKADWSVIREANSVFILPDYDIAGEKYAQGIYTRIREFEALQEIKLVHCFPHKQGGDICDFLKNLPELATWNALEGLHHHPERAQIVRHVEQYLLQHAEDIPATWKFITTKSRQRLIAANDFNRLTLPKREMLLAPWLPEGSITMVFADRGIGKTFFALSCALALVNGEEFLSYHAEQPVPVLYLDGEMQATAIQNRLRKLSRGRETKALLSLYTPDCQENDYIPDLGTEEGRKQLDELIEAANHRVIFIDNLSAFDRTGKENEAESWAPIQAWAIQHRKKGRAIVFIHHANKEGKQRGSHKKEDVMDAVIRLKRPEDAISSTDGTKIQIQYTKARHLSGEAAQDIEATLQSDGDYLQWQWEQGDIIYRKAVEMLAHKIPMREIAEELGIGKSTIHRWKSKAASDGLL